MAFSVQLSCKSTYKTVYYTTPLRHEYSNDGTSFRVIKICVVMKPLEYRCKYLINKLKE